MQSLFLSHYLFFLYICIFFPLYSYNCPNFAATLVYPSYNKDRLHLRGEMGSTVTTILPLKTTPTAISSSNIIR